MTVRKRGMKIDFIPEGKDFQQTGKIFYIHPKKRFLVVEYRVQTLMGISPPLREALRIVQGQVWTGLGGKPK